MNVPLVVAGALGLLGAAIHGIAGDTFVVRRLSLQVLPSTLFGGPMMTKTMIRVAWHMATIGLLTVGSALVLAGSVLDGESARGIGLVAAWASSGFAAVALALGVGQFRRALALRATNPDEMRALLHPGPAILLAIPVLAWFGIA